MSDKKLLPCPFCGGEATIVVEPIGKGEKLYSISCKEIDCVTQNRYFTSEEAAIKAWNTRQPMQKIVERLEYHKRGYEKSAGFCIPNPDSSKCPKAEYEAKAGALEFAIEIVKKAGGLND